MKRMTHPDLPGQEITAADSAVPIHMASDWVPIEDAASEPVAEPALTKTARRVDSTETGA